MKRDPLKANVLATQIIPNVDPSLAKELGLSPSQRSLALITSDSDDVTYTALDEATKAADVQVVYAKSMYAGAGNATTKYAGEIIGILAGPNPAEVKSGLAAAVDMIENVAHFVSANDDDSVPYYAFCISRTGSYLSKVAGIAEGEALAYLIAPPLEAVYGMDAAMKAAANESFGYSDEELVSSDTIGMSYGSLFDATQTLAQRCGTKIYEVRVVAWYDNEMSYVSQLVRTLGYMGDLV